jgi:hypothetical protein
MKLPLRCILNENTELKKSCLVQGKPKRLTFISLFRFFNILSTSTWRYPLPELEREKHTIYLLQAAIQENCKNKQVIPFFWQIPTIDSFSTYSLRNSLHFSHFSLKKLGFSFRPYGLVMISSILCLQTVPPHERGNLFNNGQCLSDFTSQSNGTSNNS